MTGLKTQRQEKPTAEEWYDAAKKAFKGYWEPLKALVKRQEKLEQETAKTAISDPKNP